MYSIYYINGIRTLSVHCLYLLKHTGGGGAVLKISGTAEVLLASKKRRKREWNVLGMLENVASCKNNQEGEKKQVLNRGGVAGWYLPPPTPSLTSSSFQAKPVPQAYTKHI